MDLPANAPPEEAVRLQTERRELQRRWLVWLKTINHLRYEPADDYALHRMLLALTDHAAELRQRFGAWQHFLTGHLESIEKRTKRQGRLLIGIAAAVVLVAAGVAVLLPLARQSERHAKTIIDGQSAAAEKQAQLATQLSRVQDALSRLQQSADPKADPISNWSRTRLESELARQMDVKVEDLRAILDAGRTSLDALLQGQALLASGRGDEAEKKFDVVIEQEQSAAHRLRKAYQGKAQIAFDKGRYEEALAFRQKAAALADQASDPQVWAYAEGEVAFVLFHLARYGEAEPLMREVIRVREEAPGPKDAELATAINNLATLLAATNRTAEAELLMKRALEIDEGGASQPRLAMHLNNLGLLLRNTPGVSSIMAMTRMHLNNLGLLLRNTHRLAEAEPLFKRALELHEASLGKNHPEVATDLNNLALVFEDTGRLAEAEPLMKRSLKIDEESLGSNHPRLAIDLNNLATLFAMTDRLAEAEPLLKRALEIDEASLGKDHPTVAIDLNNLALLLRKSSRLAEAEPLVSRALGITFLFQKRTGFREPNAKTYFGNYLIFSREMNLPDHEAREALDVEREKAGLDEASFAALWTEAIAANPRNP